MALIILFGLVGLLAGCASPVPEQLRSAPDDAPTLTQVRDAPQEYQGKRVRWGGAIADVHNKPDYTEIEIVERPLGRHGRPQDRDETQGRFMFRVDGFLEPTTYSPGRYITVLGEVAGEREGRIDEHEYTYPVVEAEDYHLWAELSEPSATRGVFYGHCYGDRWYCDPRSPGYDPRSPWCR
ncbi:Slp/YeaY family lipoprotein [Halorhodospira halochloris]|uniref:Slp/YeaY family lipoprotein n=1 Tax=Halorhodospira halochloris TaxID=1052 RepID=UPI0013A55423